MEPCEARETEDWGSRKKPLDRGSDCAGTPNGESAKGESAPRHNGPRRIDPYPYLPPQPGHPASTFGRKSFFSRYLFQWLNPLIRLSKERPLTQDDLEKLCREDAAVNAHIRLAREWNEELDYYDCARDEFAKSSPPMLRSESVPGCDRMSRHRKPSLGRALCKAFWPGMLMASLFALIESAVRLGQAILIGEIVRFFEDSNEESAHGYLLAALFVAAQFILLFTHHVYFFAAERVSWQARSATLLLLYQKSLRLSHASVSEITTGKISSLISNDLIHFDRGALFLPFIVIVPMGWSFSLWYLYTEIGWSAFVGGGCIVALLPLLGKMGKLISKYRAATLPLTDSRIKLVDEIVRGIRLIKGLAWEPPFEEKVLKIRADETARLWNSMALRAANMGTFYVSAAIIGFATFTSFVLADNDLTAVRVFVTLSIFVHLRLTTALFLPFAVQGLSEMRVTCKRFTEFLLAPELTPRRSPLLNVIVSYGPFVKSTMGVRDPTGYHVEEQYMGASEATPAPPNDDQGAGRGWGRSLSSHSPAQPALTLANGSELARAIVPGLHLCSEDKAAKPSPRVYLNAFSTGYSNSDHHQNAVNKISLKVTGNDLIAVIGPVGSGKSTLLLSILNELPAEEGTCEVDGTMSFAAQKEWIVPGSVRDNVLFGLPFEEGRYRRVLRSTRLNQDIVGFPDGDRSEVGERGVNISGGQKARLCLARACYGEADIYLLDSPLSAVDSVVGHEIFRMCIRGYLEGRLRIWVTHQREYLDKADKILVLDGGGSQVAFGTLSEIESQGVNLESYLGKNERDENVEGNPGNSQVKKDANGENAETRRKTLRRRSASSYSSIKEVHPEECTVALVKEESRNTGVVTWHTYRTFFDRCGGIPIVSVVLIFFLIAQGALVGVDLWLARWVGQTKEKRMDTQNVYIYASLVFALVMLSFLRSFLAFRVLVNGSRNLHNSMFLAIIRAPIRFFDTNPLGRIVNRFSDDVGLIDTLLPFVFVDLLRSVVGVLSFLLLVCVVNYYMLILVVPVMYMFWRSRQDFLMASREVKRLESIARSPIHILFSSTVEGLATIRAFESQKTLMNDISSKADEHTRCRFCFLALSRWLGVRLDFYSLVFIAGSAFASIPLRDELDAGFVGLTLVYVAQLMSLGQWMVRQSTVAESLMTSVERVVEYSEIDAEAARVIEDKRPPPQWPTDGRVVFDGVSFRYAPTLPPALRNLTCAIEAGERIGLVGRTGAGKSSVIQCLLRLVEFEGSIEIDGVAIKDMGLRDLRNALSVIPQEPVLFSGSIRYNLDPENCHTDRDLWEALRRSQIKEMVEGLPDGLDNEVREGGCNFSVGQRQLLCLARALVRHSKILVVDEATSHCDYFCDEVVRTAIREHFVNSTVIVVAHRLHTVIDSDKIMVLDDGYLVEFGDPHELLKDTKSILRKMLLAGGQGTLRQLERMARGSWSNRLSQKSTTDSDMGGTDADENEALTSVGERSGTSDEVVGHEEAEEEDTFGSCTVD